MEQRIFSDQVATFIGELRQAHQDNEQRDYYAKDQSDQLIPIMPVTPFVFEFIIYNSLYQVDWSDSLQTGCVKNHPECFSETNQQRKLEGFLKPYIKKEPSILHKAFLPVRETTLKSDWLGVTSDSRISAEEGKLFFCRMRRLQTLLLEPSEKFQVNNSLFKLVGNCRWYIYLVRNNIFHGSKTLGETYDPGQRKRICVYLTFLRCMTGLFFSVCDRHLLRTASHFSTEA